MSIKPRVYLDTSVISHLLATDVPEKQSDTLKLWEQLKCGEFVVVLSPVVYEEMDKCNEAHKNALYEHVRAIDVMYVEENEKIIALAEEYLQMGVLKPKSYNDCLHIAYASHSACKYMLSWNMKHFVTRKTIEMVQIVNQRSGFPQPYIMTPEMFIEEDEDNA